MNKSAKLSGIALIEVLISAFIVGVGFMALSSLQGGLVSGSRENKSRTEAMSFANSKMEELRGEVNKEDYDALDSGTDQKNGKTETFTRAWSISNSDSNSPERKIVSVSVCWLDGCSTNSNSDKIVTLQSFIAFDSLKESALLAKNAESSATSMAAGGPSVNAESSDDIRDSISLDSPTAVGTLITQGDKTYIVDGLETTSDHAVLAKSCTGLNDFENDLKTRRIDYDGVAGNEAIELYRVVKSGESEYCTPELRYNGGVIIPIRGIVHSGAVDGSGRNAAILSVEMFSFNASETGAYCYFKPETGATSAPYVCYVGGNCSGVTNTAAMDNADVTKCPVGAYSAAKVGYGGWRGKVGLRGVAGGSTYYNVCFQEEISDTPETLDTARNYYSRRNGDNEGINKPYSCHDFLIINGRSNESAVHRECSERASHIGGISLASKTIQRDITTGNNIFDYVIDTSFCRTNTYDIVGSILGTGDGVPQVNVIDGSTAASCSATATQYTCNDITTSSDSLTISGTYSNQTVSCILSPPSNAGCALTFSPNAPQYVVTGSISGNSKAIQLNVTDGSINTPCIIAETGGGYTCKFQTTNTTGIAINATAQIGYSVSPSTYNLSTLSGQSGVVTIAGQTFNVSTVSAYIVSGSISLGNNVDNITSVAVSIENGSCTLTAPNGGWKKNTSGTYSCTAYTGSSSMTFAISPNCSNSKSGNTPAPEQYLMTSGSTSSSGTGQLVIDFGQNGLGSNTTKNLNVTESGTACGATSSTSSN